MKKILFIVLQIFAASFIYSQVHLNSSAASWNNVLPGKAICEPQQTSYGLALITDSKYLMTFTTEGNTIWEHYLGRGTNHMFSVLNDDFFAVISNSKLTVLNPSGKELWQTTLDYKPFEKPFAGRDGRIIVRNATNISCYGLNGIRKWHITTEEQTNLEIKELPDGTFVVFLKKQQENKTRGLRISPFGEILENITFYGNVTSAESCSEGILLTFSDSTCGLFTLVEQNSTNRWVLQKERLSLTNSDFFVVSKDLKEAAYINNQSSGTQINFIQLSDGKITHTVNCPAIQNPTYCILNNQGIFLANKNTACFYNKDGLELWTGIMPQNVKGSKNNWKYCVYTDDNYLIIFYDNWDATGYRTTQSLKSQTVKYKLERKNYNKLYDVNYSTFEISLMPDLDNLYSSDDRFESLQKGDYSEKEQKWISDLISGCNSYQKLLTTVNSRNSYDNSLFVTDNIGVELMISQLCFYGTDTFINFIAAVIKNEKNRTMLNKALIGIKYNGYDPEEKILYALESLLRKTKPSDAMVLNEICDAVYSICRFMGRPAFNQHGREILLHLLVPDYNKNTKDYAKKTLKMISELEL
ncbi:MAG: PQQ-like beta-propeller repeat protein [Treponema sp.]|nr:PQQ-like beta-propeller repeat protein [Treponema sp.]